MTFGRSQALAFAFLVVAAPSLRAEDKGASSASANPVTRQFAFTYTTTVKDIPSGTKEVDVWIPLPYESEFQKATVRQVAAPVNAEETKESKYGNRMLHFRVPNPPARFDVTVDF